MSNSSGISEEGLPTIRPESRVSLPVRPAQFSMSTFEQNSIDDEYAFGHVPTITLHYS